MRHKAPGSEHPVAALLRRKSCAPAQAPTVQGVPEVGCHGPAKVLSRIGKLGLPDWNSVPIVSSGGVHAA